MARLAIYADVLLHLLARYGVDPARLRHEEARDLLVRGLCHRNTVNQQEHIPAPVIQAETDLQRRSKGSGKSGKESEKGGDKQKQV